MQTEKREVGTPAICRGKVFPFSCSHQSYNTQHESWPCKKWMIFPSSAGGHKYYIGPKGLRILLTFKSASKLLFYILFYMHCRCWVSSHPLLPAFLLYTKQLGELLLHSDWLTKALNIMSGNVNKIKNIISIRQVRFNWDWVLMFQCL